MNPVKLLYIEMLVKYKWVLLPFHAQHQLFLNLIFFSIYFLDFKPAGGAREGSG